MKNDEIIFYGNRNVKPLNLKMRLHIGLGENKNMA